MRRRNSATSISQQKPTRTRMGKGKRIDSRERQKAIKPEYLEANKKHCQRGEGKILLLHIILTPSRQLYVVASQCFKKIIHNVFSLKFARIQTPSVGENWLLALMHNENDFLQFSNTVILCSFLPLSPAAKEMIFLEGKKRAK